MTRGWPSNIGIEPRAKGPTIIPAINSPKTAGSLSLLKTSANIFAAKSRTAREIKTCIIASCSAAIFRDYIYALDLIKHTFPGHQELLGPIDSTMQNVSGPAIKAKALTEINNKDEHKRYGILNMCLSILGLFWYSTVIQEIIPTI